MVQSLRACFILYIITIRGIMPLKQKIELSSLSHKDQGRAHPKCQDVSA